MGCKRDARFFGDGPATSPRGRLGSAPWYVGESGFGRSSDLRVTLHPTLPSFRQCCCRVLSPLTAAGAVPVSHRFPFCDALGRQPRRSSSIPRVAPGSRCGAGWSQSTKEGGIRMRRQLMVRGFQGWDHCARCGFWGSPSAKPSCVDHVGRSPGRRLCRPLCQGPMMYV